jgi:hypothetical protein
MNYLSYSSLIAHYLTGHAENIRHNVFHQSVGRVIFISQCSTQLIQLFGVRMTVRSSQGLKFQRSIIREILPAHPWRKQTGNGFMHQNPFDRCLLHPSPFFTFSFRRRSFFCCCCCRYLLLDHRIGIAKARQKRSIG